MSDAIPLLRPGENVAAEHRREVVTQASEISHYDAGARTDAALATLVDKVEDARRQLREDSLPDEAWLDTLYDSVAQLAVVRHVSPLVRGGHVLQVGGTGLMALKALVAGATSATHLTPSQGEADVTRAAADRCGLGERLHSEIAFAEEMSFADGRFDVVVSEASMHHTNFGQAIEEIARVLRVGGRFGCFEPWRAPLYGLGTRVLGKRDPGVTCKPMEASRIVSLGSVLPESRVEFHGALSRYALIGLGKLGVPISREFAHRATALDDRITKPFPRLRSKGSSVAILATKR